MSSNEMERWPRFKIVTYSAPTGIPNGWDAELLAKGRRTACALRLTRLNT